MSNKDTPKAEKSLFPEALGILLAFSLVGLVLILGKLIVEDLPIAVSDYIQLLTLSVIFGALCVAIWVQRRREKFDRSFIYLDNAIELMEKAKQVLIATDGKLSNNRIDWVTSARLISRVEQIAMSIEINAHKKIYDAMHDFYRHEFGEYLSGGGNTITAAFFLGVDNPNVNLGAAAFDEGQEKDAGSWIPPRILAVVYRFFEYPDGYEDPLDASHTLTTREMEKLWLHDHKGLVTYLTFRKHFYRIRNNVYRAANETSSSRQVTQKDVDEEMRSLSGKFY